jgi:hypothetical protein
MLPDGFMDGVREDGTVEGMLVETHFCELESAYEDSRGYYRLVADAGPTDVEIRIPFTTLATWGWRRGDGGPVVGADGVARIAAERQRQMGEKGWSLEHDRTEHADGSLTDAAAALILEYDGAPEVEKKDAELSSAQEAYLRACGWAHTCDAPGSVWLWARPYQGRVLLVPREFAVHMQDHIDSGVYSAEGEPRDALERMGEDMHPAFTAPDTRDPLAHGATANDARADAEIAAMDQDDRLRRIANIIDGVDNRCAAADGPVTPTLQEMTQIEMSAIYALAIGRNT